MMSLIYLDRIQKHYGKGQSGVCALGGISFSIETGEMIAVVGKSGSGKSTLLNILGGLDYPTDGEYSFAGKRIDRLKPNHLAEFRRCNIGFVVQHFALIDDMTVFDNIALPLRYRKMAGKLINEKVEHLLADMEISDKRKAYPPELSSGQCQRVAIARAIINKPSVLLADEPTGALDEQTGCHIMDIIRNLNEQGMTTIIATHDRDIASSCQRIIQLSDGHIV